VFEVACRNARSPTEVDEVTGIAFKIALNRTRWHVGVWGWYCWYGTESERLIEFIYQCIEKDVLNPACNKFDAPSFVKNRVVDAIHSSVRSAVTSACKPAIASAIEASKPVMAQIQATCKEGINPILDAEAALKKQVIDLVTETARPALDKLGEVAINPVLTDMVGTITPGFTAAIAGWHTKMTDRAGRDFADFDAFDKDVIKYSERWLDYWWSENVLEESYQKLWEIRSDANPLYKHRDKLPSSFGTGDMYWESRDAVKMLMRRALHTLRAAKPDSKEARVAAVAQVTAKLVADAKVVEHDLLIRILENVVLYDVESNIVNPAQRLVDPVAKAVDQLPKPLQPLFDVKALVAEVIYGILRNAITIIVDNVYGAAAQEIDAAGAAILKA
jgi:hypothetical protein